MAVASYSSTASAVASKEARLVKNAQQVHQAGAVAADGECDYTVGCQTTYMGGNDGCDW